MRKNGLHINEHGTKCWYKDGFLHRDDGPAITYPDGTQEWWKDGSLHRDDGPAVINADANHKWYKYGKRYHPSAHEIMTWKMNERLKI